ncbi:hypothetical protein BABINDRAFT_160698 [Babjeviella inositovora NRRL Y-12698]|uniref:37S ribosomal protein S35, mitochondrial n=1 Tax=Babjeviella inositovora NRRL Y-12698 TaxID=984486 RepID=A0A1E3QUI5_9ASCO|nr:uncharacterized protein BABINDRAFT_160698 [Babjeviella inositovora NRRL Y-12698]ODQ81339.1 hypothetical protein BABINDRAFT_160698 [Babjeviella inositovora NRRL Y-12698]
MLRSTTSLGGLETASVINMTQKRFGSRRKPAYPSYPTKPVPKTQKYRQTKLRSFMNQFLGPRNFKGEYYLNKYANAPQNHTPNYIKPHLERGNSLIFDPEVREHQKATGIEAPVEEKSGFQLRRERELALQPFPQNEFCKTNYVIDNRLKAEIAQRAELTGNFQELAVKYGIKIPRVEAIVKLHQIKQKMMQEKQITKDMEVMGQTMYKMFPVYNKNVPERVMAAKGISPENLTEVPINKTTQYARFVTIAESEPFGAVDAAEDFGVEAAAVTLSKLTELGEVAFHAQLNKTKKTEVAQKLTNDSQGIYVGEVRKGEKHAFRFQNATVGEVGERYGKGNRDNRPNRPYGFDAYGKRIWL